MAATARPNVSNDLIWGIARSQNAYLVKRSSGGGSQFSSDPLNLVNKQSRKYAGFANNKAIGVQAAENGGVTVTTKKPGNPNQPASTFVTNTSSPNTTSRNLYKGIANRAAKHGYRADLRADAVYRASAIRKSQKPKKDTPANKLRGAQARKAAEKAA